MSVVNITKTAEEAQHFTNVATSDSWEPHQAAKYNGALRLPVIECTQAMWSLFSFVRAWVRKPTSQGPYLLFGGVLIVSIVTQHDPPKLLV